jgi:hypothetical protein
MYSTIDLYRGWGAAAAAGADFVIYGRSIPKVVFSLILLTMSGMFENLGGGLCRSTQKPRQSSYKAIIRLELAPSHNVLREVPIINFSRLQLESDRSPLCRRCRES